MKLKKLSELKSLEGNPRKIDKEDYERLKRSLRTFPKMLKFRPLVIDEDNVILWWNQRLKVLTELKIKEVPVNIFTKKDIQEAIQTHKESEFIIRDNIQNGHWDYEELKDWDRNNLDDWWLDYEFEEEVDTSKEDIEDDVPETPENIIVEEWDIFQLWEHRLMCWSSTNQDDLEKLLGGKQSDMVFTDPPYLMDFTGWIHADGSKSYNSKHGGIKNDKMTEEEGRQFLDDINTNILIFNKGAFYITFYRLGIDKYFASMDRVWMQYRSLIIWSKGNHTLSNSDYMSRYEPIFYWWSQEHNFYGWNNWMDIWEIDRTQKNDLHPTMKPVELVDKAINDWSKPWDIVLDLFAWSGTTLISAEKNKRIGYMMELDPKYIQVILKRYNMYTDWRKEITCLNRELDLSSIFTD